MRLLLSPPQRLPVESASEACGCNPARKGQRPERPALHFCRGRVLPSKQPHSEGKEGLPFRPGACRSPLPCPLSAHSHNSLPSLPPTAFPLLPLPLWSPAFPTASGLPLGPYLVYNSYFFLPPLPLRFSHTSPPPHFCPAPRLCPIPSRPLDCKHLGLQSGSCLEALVPSKALQSGVILGAAALKVSLPLRTA